MAGSRPRGKKFELQKKNGKKKGINEKKEKGKLTSAARASAIVVALCGPVSRLNRFMMGAPFLLDFSGFLE